VVESAFETWEPTDGERFDLVFAATAWHSVNPSVRYQRAWRLLRPGGHLAFWERRARIPGRRRSLLCRDPGCLRGNRRGPTEGGEPAASRRAARRARRNRAQRPLRGADHPPLRLGGRLHRGGLPAAAGHLHGSHRHASLAARRPLQRESAAGSRSGRTGACAGTGAQSFTWPAAPTARRSRKRIRSCDAVREGSVPLECRRPVPEATRWT
jgi:SAM-dependent methyltransferase